MDFGLVFLNLIPLRYIYNITLMLIHTKNCLRAAYQFAKFHKKLETENLATAHLKAKKLFQYTPGTTRKLLQSKPSLHAQGIGRTYLLSFQNFP